MEPVDRTYRLVEVVKDEETHEGRMVTLRFVKEDATVKVQDALQEMLPSIIAETYRRIIRGIAQTES